MSPYRELVPHAALRPYVDRFWIRSDGAAVPAPFRIMPDGCIDILVDCVAGTPPIVVGAMTRAQVVVLDAPVHLIAVRFRPGGAVPFLRTAVDELTDQDVACADLGLGDLIPPGLGDGEALTAAVARLEAALLARLRQVTAPDPRIRHAVRALVAAHPLTVDALARDLGWSRQHLTRTLRSQTGLAPKQLARTARLQRAATLLQRRASASVAEVAARTGYFDQAHMATDFRELVGVAPRVVREATGSIFPIPSMFEEV